MAVRISLLFAALAIAAAGPAIAAAARPDGTVTPKFSHAITNLPGKSMVAVEVDYPPGGVTDSHHHPASAFIYAHVISGAVRSQVAGEPAHVYRAGEGWYEAPGAHHLVSENASKTVPARMLAVFVVDSGDMPLVIPDHH